MQLQILATVESHDASALIHPHEVPQETPSASTEPIKLCIKRYKLKSYLNICSK